MVNWILTAVVRSVHTYSSTVQWEFSLPYLIEDSFFFSLNFSYTLISRFASLIGPEETRHKPKRCKTKQDFPYICIDFHLIGSVIHNFSWKSRCFNKKIFIFSKIVFICIYIICMYVFTLDLNGKSPFFCFSFI